MNYYLYKLLFVFFFLLAFCDIDVNSQSNAIVEESAPEKDWFTLMQNPDVNFAEVQKQFYDHWATMSYYRVNGYMIFKRWKYINESHVLPDGKLQTPDYVMNEYTKYMKGVDYSKSNTSNWSLVRPSEYPVNEASQRASMGRVSAIAFHQTNANTIFN